MSAIPSSQQPTGSAFCMVHIALPEQALRWFPLCLDMVEEAKFSCTQYHIIPSVHAVRQLEQRVKVILDSIAPSEDRKRELIRGDAVDKAEQLSKSGYYCSHWDSWLIEITTWR